MRRYFLGKVVQAGLALVLLTSVVFLLSRVSGSPVDLMLPLEADEEDRRALTERLGLDEPVYVQYWNFVNQSARLDFGVSTRSREPAMDLVLERTPSSVQLAAGSLALSLVVGIPAGIVSARRRGRWQDQTWRAFAILSLALPSFWTGILLIQLFAAQWQVLPAGGDGSWRHVVLPVVTLSASVVAGQIRLMRSSMLEVLDREFITMARAKGLTERRVIWRHGMRNAILPVLTYSGMYLSLMITAAVIVENVFAWPGLGRLVFESVTFRDFPVVQAVVLLVGAAVIGIQLLVDVLYAIIDPRVRIS